MTYTETIGYLYHTLPMFSRMGSAAFKKDLTNILILCGKLDNPQERFKTIHVGGTNGKGSVSHMMAAVFQECGYRTGLYTSPHLYDFRERIRLNGKICTEKFVVEFVEKIRPLIEEIQPSFFEITVAMAFEWFAINKVDIAVIEVGLGGRLDSTNIIQPELSVITNIGWDHMNLLGNSLEEIATEKAGIIKPRIPVVIGERSAATDPVFEQRAKETNAPIYFAEDHYRPLQHRWDKEKLLVSISETETDSRHDFSLDLPGLYQQKNLCTVLTAFHVFNDTGLLPRIPMEKIQSALQVVKEKTGLHGRWERIQREPDIVLDVAHNPEGIKELVHHIHEMEYDRLHIILGMVKDKDIMAVLQLLPSTAQYYFTQADLPRALPFPELESKARSLGLKGKGYPDVQSALEAARSAAGKNDLVLVCGSIFLIAEVGNQVVF